MENEKPLTLLHILNNQCLLPVFRIYCKSQGIEEYLNFWFEIRAYTNKYLYEPSSGSRAESSDCSFLFKKYFLPTSIYKIVIDPKIANELQENICRKKQCTMAAFEAPQRFVYDVLELRMKEFGRSEAYKSFLKREQSLYQKQAEQTYDIKELEIHIKRINDASKHLKIIYTELSNKLSSNSVAVSNLSALAERFIEYSTSIKQADNANELVYLVDCLLKVANVIKSLESLEVQMNKAITNSIKPLKSVIDNELPSAINLSKKYEKVTSSDSSTLDTLQILRNTNNRIDHQTFSALCELMEQYLGYFEKGYALLQEVLPEVEKYRQVVKDSQETKK